MKVAVLNRDPAAFPGGDLIHIAEMTKALGEMGVERTYAPEGWNAKWLQQFDLVHLYHINFGWCRQNFNGVWESGKPYIITCVFYPTENLGVDAATMREALRRAAAVVCYSLWETAELRQTTGYAGVVDVIPPGASQRFHATNVDQRGRGKGVLAVAARGGDKNVDIVKKVCKEYGYPYTLAKGIDHADLPEVYEAHRVFINASGSERMGLTIIEALASGCRVLATKYSRGLEWFPGIVKVDPFDLADLRAKLKLAYTNGDWDYTPNVLARILTWELLASQYKRLYEEVLSG